MTKDAWMKLSSTITNTDGTVWHRIKIKEEDYVPEWAGLMTVKSEEPVVKAQFRAENMRKSRKQELISKRRELGLGPAKSPYPKQPFIYLGQPRGMNKPRPNVQ